MRFYKTKSIRDIIAGYREKESGLLATIELQKELFELWRGLSDKRLNSIKVTFKIQKGERLSIICPSPTTLSYVRQRRSYIVQSLMDFMSENNIPHLEIRLK